MDKLHELEILLNAQIENPDLICKRRDKRQIKRDIYRLRIDHNLCPVDARPPVYDGAVYCGAGCAARDGA